MGQNNGKLQVKDLVTIGIFTALYIVVTLVFEVCGGIAPIVWIFMPAFVALAGGVVYMTLTAKVQKWGAPFIMGTVMALIFCVRGGYALVLVTTMVIFGLLAEAVRKHFGYQNLKANLYSYPVFAMGMVGNLLPIWIFKDAFFNSRVDAGMPQAYYDMLEALVSPTLLILMILATFVCGILGAFLGKALVRKHLEKAGMLS